MNNAIFFPSHLRLAPYTYHLRSFLKQTHHLDSEIYTEFSSHHRIRLDCMISFSQLGRRLLVCPGACVGIVPGLAHTGWTFSRDTSPYSICTSHFDLPERPHQGPHRRRIAHRGASKGSSPLSLLTPSHATCLASSADTLPLHLLVCPNFGDAVMTGPMTR